MTQQTCSFSADGFGLAYQTVYELCNQINVAKTISVCKITLIRPRLDAMLLHFARQQV